MKALIHYSRPLNSFAFVALRTICIHPTTTTTTTIPAPNSACELRAQKRAKTKQRFRPENRCGINVRNNTGLVYDHSELPGKINHHGIPLFYQWNNVFPLLIRVFIAQGLFFKCYYSTRFVAHERCSKCVLRVAFRTETESEPKRTGFEPSKPLNYEGPEPKSKPEPLF